MDLGLLGASGGGGGGGAGAMVTSMGRESRAQEAIRMKDEQLKVLTDQNSQLLGSLDAMEEEANRVQTEKLAIDEENRRLKDQNFELRNKTRAAETAAKKALAEMADKDSQLKIMTDQNSELLRLLEQEEAQTAQLQQTNDLLRDELETLKTKCVSRAGGIRGPFNRAVSRRRGVVFA
jgi:chromosome segregation ATPase